MHHALMLSFVVLTAANAGSASVPLGAAEGDSFGLTGDTCDIVIGDKAPATVCFAAMELTNYLSRATSAPWRITDRPKPDRLHIYLGGACPQAGVCQDVNVLKRDGFVIRSVPTGVCLAGRDDVDADPLERIHMSGSQGRWVWRDTYEHGTLNAVYEFLERFVGVRMYFPGELGTIVPTLSRVKVPKDLNIRSEPCFVRREYRLGPGVGAWFGASEETPEAVQEREGRLWLWRRMGTMPNTGSHGLRYFHYVDRFKASHPEYFLMNEKGERVPFDSGTAPFWKNGKLCHTSGIVDEIYRDVRAFLTGRTAASRGIRNRLRDGTMADCWGPNCLDLPTGRQVNIMPEDGFRPCQCPVCRAAYRQDDPSDYAADLIWNGVASIANRLKREGIAGDICMAAYSPYSRLPEAALPDNVYVDVAVSGPYALSVAEKMERDLDSIRAWRKKTGRKIGLLIYSGKFSYANRSPDVPQSTPRAYARFFRTVAPYIDGVKAYPRTDRWLYNYLNLYVFAKVCWDPTLDVEQLLSEHDRLMFGAAAKPMGEYLRLVEERWLGYMNGPAADGPLGKYFTQPTDEQMWTVAYSRDVFARIDALFAEAGRVVAAGSIEARRIRLIRDEFVERARKRAERFWHKGGSGK